MSEALLLNALPARALTRCPSIARSYPSRSMVMLRWLAKSSMKSSGTPSESYNLNASSPDITFPYGFPAAGHYRLFVQIKRAGRVETGVFDTQIR